MARPKGIKNAPGTLKPGRKPAKYCADRLYKDADIVTYKRKLVALLNTEEATNLTDAANLLEMPPIDAHRWYKNDKLFREDVQLAEQIRADRLLQSLDEKDHVLGLMFHIKKIRPEFRDNAKIEIQNNQFATLMENIRRAGAGLPLIETVMNPAVIPAPTVQPLVMIDDVFHPAPVEVKVEDTRFDSNGLS